MVIDPNRSKDRSTDHLTDFIAESRSSFRQIAGNLAWSKGFWIKRTMNHF